MNIEDQNSINILGKLLPEKNKNTNLASLLLSSDLFKDEIFSMFKENEEINSIDDLVEEFMKNKEAVKKLLCLSIKEAKTILKEKSTKNNKKKQNY